MNYPHQATTSSYDFSLWPDASAASEEMMAWAQAAGCAQLGPTIGNISFDDLLDPTLAWEQTGTAPAETFSFQNYSVSIFAFGT